MLLTTLAVALTIGVTATEEKALVCPIMGSEVSKDSPAVEYAGTKFAFCCGGCDGTFTKDPNAYIKKSVKEGNTIGVFLFDPIGGRSIDVKKAKGTSDYKGIRYYFLSEENKAVFDKSAKKYSVTPKKELLTCAVNGCEILTYSDAGAFADYNGVRYYAECEGCVDKLLTNPAQYATSDGLTEPKVIPFVKKIG